MLPWKKNVKMNSIFVEQNGKLVEQRSRFLSFVFPCKCLDEQTFLIKKMNSDYPTATHICWASVIDSGKIEYFFSDNGEPSGTAGVPILNSLKEHQLVNVIAFVVRYFGGVKLGTTGLAKAYKEATDLCLNNVVEVVKKRCFAGVSSYENFDRVKKIAMKNNDIIEDVKYCEDIEFLIYINEDEEKLYSFLNNFVDKHLFKYVEKK